jgi:hypothetical protein
MHNFCCIDLIPTSWRNEKKKLKKSNYLKLKNIILLSLFLLLWKLTNIFIQEAYKFPHISVFQFSFLILMEDTFLTEPSTTLNIPNLHFLRMLSWRQHRITLWCYSMCPSWQWRKWDGVCFWKACIWGHKWFLQSSPLGFREGFWQVYSCTGHVSSCFPFCFNPYRTTKKVN